eukprot:jgi/Mesvir1/6003/Mv00751-RA.2
MSDESKKPVARRESDPDVNDVFSRLSVAARPVARPASAPSSSTGKASPEEVSPAAPKIARDTVTTTSKRATKEPIPAVRQAVAAKAQIEASLPEIKILQEEVKVLQARLHKEYCWRLQMQSLSTAQKHTIGLLERSKADITKQLHEARARASASTTPSRQNSFTSLSGDMPVGARPDVSNTGTNNNSSTSSPPSGTSSVKQLEQVDLARRLGVTAASSSGDRGEANTLGQPGRTAVGAGFGGMVQDGGGRVDEGMRTFFEGGEGGDKGAVPCTCACCQKGCRHLQAQLQACRDTVASLEEQLMLVTSVKDGLESEVEVEKKRSRQLKEARAEEQLMFRQKISICVAGLKEALAENEYTSNYVQKVEATVGALREELQNKDRALARALVGQQGNP